MLNTREVMLNTRDAALVRHRRSLIRWGLVAVSVLCLVSAIALAQNSSSSQAAQPNSDSPASKPAATSTVPPEPPRPDWLPKAAVWTGSGWITPTPLPAQYENFFAWTIHLDEQADLHDKEGKDESWLRKHLEETIGLSPAEVELVRQAARRNQEETKAFNEKIVAAIPLAKSPNHEVPLPPEIDEMQKQRDDATMLVVKDLEEKLGPDATKKLETWREKHWAVTQNVQQAPLPPGAEKAWRELNLKRYQEMKKQTEQHSQEKLQQQQKAQESQQ